MDACRFSQQDVPADMDRFGLVGDALEPVPLGKFPVGYEGAFYERVVLAMRDDGAVQRLGERHGVLHHLRVLHTHAVIGKPDRSGILERREIRQLAAEFILRNGCVRKHSYHAFGGRLVEDEPDRLRRIRHRPRVRHRSDRGKPALGRGLGSAANRFLVFETRFSEVHMHIDEPGRNQLALCVDHFAARRVRRLGTVLPLGDFAIRNFQVPAADRSGLRVDGRSVHNPGCHAGCSSSISNTSLRVFVFLFTLLYTCKLVLSLFRD
jgi:hypothetical protein